MPKYRHKFRCIDCDNKWSRVFDSMDAPMPPCPKCKKRQKNIGMDYNGKAPAMGGSIRTRAIDDTMEGVMKDYGMTDLHTSNLREGDIMAPKLAPALQSQVDSFWGGPKNMRGARLPVPTLGAAVNGAYAQGAVDPIKRLHDQRSRPAVNIIASDRPKV